MNVKISNGNSKMGNIPSVSLPAGVTCRPDIDCISICYANKLARIRKNVKAAYQHNYDLLKMNPEIYWREVEASIMMSRFFRFHVSGDIPDMNYLENMVKIASRNRHCQILCFTKKYDIVNDWVAKQLVENSVFEDKLNQGHFEVVPENLHILMSGWRDVQMNNPYLFPEAHVRYKDGSTTAKPDAKECGGNCTICAMTEGGCWNLKQGEQVVFNEH